MDIYNEKNANTIRTKCYDFLKEQSPTKLTALTECGGVATIGQQWTAGAHWLWFMPWYDYNVTNNVNSSAFNQTSHCNADITWWTEAFSNDYVLTRDDVKALMASGITSPSAVHGVTETVCYTIDGCQIAAPQHGLNVVKMSDGNVRKVMVK